MSRYRIALLFEYATLNGGERSMLAVLDWLQANDSRFEFVAIAPATGRLADALRDRKIPVDDRPLKATDGQPLSPGEVEARLKQLVESRQPDLLHANSLSMGRWTGRIVKDLQIPTTSHLRDIIKLSRATIGDLNQNSRLIAVSCATREFHVAQGVSDERCGVVYNGLDLNRFQPRPSTGRLHAELQSPFVGLGTAGSKLADTSLTDAAPPVLSTDIRHVSPTPERPLLIATIGQIGLRKGQDILAAAAPLVVQQVPQAHFLVIGERSSQKLESIEFEASLIQQFAQAQLSDHLHLLGHRDDVAEILNEIDLLVHPANQEPFGRVLLEASASGVPIVATDVGGTAEIILDGTTGILVPPRDPVALANAMIDLLTSAAKSAALRRQSRERAVRDFSVMDSAKKLSQVWVDLVDGRVAGIHESAAQV